ncbi:MAG TPA: GNAT family N-acetyltransferase [Planctomycetota bacterium]|nr:GNAT family N-acetyltransferase [Planctomycetota bacterium]
MAPNHRLRLIEPRDDAEVARLIRDVMTEHGAVGPGYSIEDPEVDAMSRWYPPPDAAYWVATGDDDVPLGAGGFARLVGTAPEDAVCELRKMYFRPALRGLGLGRRLLDLAMSTARAAGYRTMYLETLASMADAERLYRAAGFAPRCAPMGATGHGGCDRWYSKPL